MAKIIPTEIFGLYLVQPEVHGDDRGHFVEVYRREWFKGDEMVQGNRSLRRAGTVVGLHYHHHQADYWSVASGHLRAVLLDIRVGSPTEGTTLSVDLGELNEGANNHLGLYIPAGVAHGGAAISETVLTYLVDRYYNPADELGVAWDDPAVAHLWGLDDPLVSGRDRTNPDLIAIAPEQLPVYHRPSS